MISFPTSSGSLNLAQEIGTNYSMLGVFLLEDINGELIASIESELQRNAVNINCRVFRLWLSGKGRQPVSWATLVTVLQNMGLKELAKKIATVKL